jgi:hypothetical protein
MHSTVPSFRQLPRTMGEQKRPLRQRQSSADEEVTESEHVELP